MSLVKERSRALAVRIAPTIRNRGIRCASPAHGIGNESDSMACYLRLFAGESIIIRHLTQTIGISTAGRGVIKFRIGQSESEK